MMICPVHKNAHTTPHEPALITDERTYSYSELDKAINSLRHSLATTGIKEHQGIAFVAHTEVPTILLLFALFRLNATACPLSFRLPEEQISQACKQLKASSFINPHTLPLSETEVPPLSPLLHLNSPATFLFTSGSSGTPKIACLSLGNHYYNALGAVQALQVSSTTRWLLSLPLFHVSGLAILFRCFEQGATVVLSKKPLEQALSDHNITHVSLVPTQLYRLLQKEEIPALKCLLLGGAPLPPALIEKALEKNLPLYPTYGMTEMGSMITLSGKTLPFRELKVDENSEIWVRGKTLFMGYWDTATETIAKVDPHEWFPTKDIGKWTPDGTLEIVGRKDRLFISGGENIQPEEIERALCAIAGIRQATVLPISDPEFGHRPVALIEDETGGHTLESIRAALKTTLPSFMHPVRILPYPEHLGLKPNLGLLREKLMQS